MSMRQKAAKILSSILVTVMLSLLVLPLGRSYARAESAINVSVSPQKLSIGQGDILKIDIVADNMPQITSFGPIVLGFNTSVAEYISFEQGSNLKNFIFTETSDDGLITISAVDQYAQDVDSDEYFAAVIDVIR